MENLSVRGDIDLICLAIKLLFSSIQHWQSGAVDGETDDKVNKTDASLKEGCIRKLSVKLVSKLKCVLDYYMPDNYQSNALTRELKVRYYSLHCIILLRELLHCDWLELDYNDV